MELLERFRRLEKCLNNVGLAESTYLDSLVAILEFDPEEVPFVIESMKKHSEELRAIVLSGMEPK